MYTTHHRKNVTIGGHRTSLCLELEIWDALDEIGRREGLTLHQLCSLIDERRPGPNRSSAVRAFTVAYFRTAATDAGHASAGHGALSAPLRSLRRGYHLDLETRRRVLSALYFERRHVERRQESALAFDPDRRVRRERRDLAVAAE